jgi:hypothetical protein
MWRLSPGWPAHPRSRTMDSAGGAFVPRLTRITRDRNVMGGKPCVRGMRVTVGTIVGLVASGRTNDEIRTAFSADGRTHRSRSLVARGR